MSINNSVFLHGRLTKDVELRQNKDKAVALFKVATDDGKTKAGDKVTNFHDCVAFGNTAESISKFFSKGDPIMVSGSLSSRSYTNKEGDKVYTTEVIVDRFAFPLQKPKSAEQARPGEFSELTGDDGGLPF